jgi:hypothetical protein
MSTSISMKMVNTLEPVYGTDMIDRNEPNYKDIEDLCRFIASQPKRLGIADLEKLADFLNFYLEDYYRTAPMYQLDDD